MRISTEAKIEETGIGIQAFNQLRRAGYHTIGDLTNKTVYELWHSNKLSTRSFRETLISLDQSGFRLADCSEEQYPDLDGSLDQIITACRQREEAERVRPWNYGMKMPKEFFSADCILPFENICIPGIDDTAGLFCVTCQPEYHLKSYGVQPGAIMIFDRGRQHKEGILSCFSNADGDICFAKYEVSGCCHIGSLVTVINYYN